MVDLVLGLTYLNWGWGLMCTIGSPHALRVGRHLRRDVLGAIRVRSRAFGLVRPPLQLRPPSPLPGLVECPLRVMQ